MKRTASDALAPWRPGSDGAWDRAAVVHLWRRAGFGARPAHVERALAQGLEAELERLLHPAGHDPRLLSGAQALLGADSLPGLQAWWMALILGDGDPLGERLALFWHDHFATSNDKVADVRLMHRQNELLRSGARGDFRALLRALAKDPAMLLWLDGNSNRSGHANENFAREVMELFALGIGNYCEQDVLEAARAFTGWGTEGREFRARAEHHDGGEKVVFGARGRFDGDGVLDLILRQPACPRHVARRLLQEFVGFDPGEGVVAELARELVRADWRIERAVEVVLRSRLFFSERARRARISGPVECVAMAVRALDASVPPAAAARAAERMGQALFRPPSVKGWDGGRAWIHAGTWIARHEFLTALAFGANLAARAERTALDTEGARRWAAQLLGCEPDSEFVATILAAGRDSADVWSAPDALARAVALILSSPEFQLV